MSKLRSSQCPSTVRGLTLPLASCKAFSACALDVKEAKAKPLLEPASEYRHELIAWWPADRQQQQKAWSRKGSPPSLRGMAISHTKPAGDRSCRRSCSCTCTNAHQNVERPYIQLTEMIIHQVDYSIFILLPGGRLGFRKGISFQGTQKALTLKDRFRRMSLHFFTIAPSPLSCLAHSFS